MDSKMKRKSFDKPNGAGGPHKKFKSNGHGPPRASGQPPKVLGDVVSAKTSREAHMQQKALAQERKMSKPNADAIQRSKKIWERLRRKSHVPKDERQKLVAELFEIVTGQVKDFVFKHDSVRVVQCAIKYANMSQRKMIARELSGCYRELAESRYAKFLIGKLLVKGDEEVRDLIVPEFYGHVKRLITQSEASWILDDIYRGIATKSQKKRLLSEWYGKEWAIWQPKTDEEVPADLKELLEKSPEKRMPVLKYLHALINQLVQKRSTGFTMLHDAMLQYYLNIKPNSEDATEFLELLKDDEEGDLLKNLAFTQSGSRVVSLALANSNAKERKQILKAYKGHVEMLGYDANGHMVLLAAFDTVDDTVFLAKSVISELVGGSGTAEDQHEKIAQHAVHPTMRKVLLYPFVGFAKWLLSTAEKESLAEVHQLRVNTSKKDPKIRQEELVAALSPSLLATIASQTQSLVTTSFGCQFITEVLFTARGDKQAAIDAVAAVAVGDPTAEGHLAKQPAAGRMYKHLVLGGHFNQETKQVALVDPPLHMDNALYAHIKEFVQEWANGDSSFVVVNMLESEGFDSKKELLALLKKDKKRLTKSGEGGNQGAVMLLEKL